MLSSFLPLRFALFPLPEIVFVSLINRSTYIFFSFTICITFSVFLCLRKEKAKEINNILVLLFLFGFFFNFAIYFSPGLVVSSFEKMLSALLFMAFTCSQSSLNVSSTVRLV